MTRREMRDHVFKLLFIRDFHDLEETDEQFELYMQHFPAITETECDEIKKRFNDVIIHIDRIDPILSDATSGWKLNRMNKTDLCVLRFAVFEIIFDENIPEKVAINEAVELAKQYGGESSSSFVNGVLAKVIRK